MKAFSRTTVAALLATTALAACSKSENQPLPSRMINVAAIANDPTKTGEQKAEALALGAEQLAQGHAAMYAYDVAREALKHDAQNVRARLWSATLAPFMELEGIYTRIEPLMRKRPDLYKNFSDNVAWLKKSPDQDLAKFLLNGPADIHSEAELQDLIARFTLRLDELRETLKSLKDEEIAISIAAEDLRRGSLENAVRTCTARWIAEGVYDVQNCDFSTAYQVRLNRADFEMLQQMVAGYETYLTLLNSYDLTGVFVLASNRHETSEQRLEKLLKNPAFGRLRSANGFGVIPTIAKDAALAVRYAASMQAELCPGQGQGAPERHGHLFPNEFCFGMTSALDSQLRALDLILSGTPVLYNATVSSQNIPVLVDAGSFFKAPPQDVRTALPLEKNSCGHLIAAGDGKLGGLFPNGDLNVLLAAGVQDDACN